ncbi:MAG: Hsp20/alpha crystallin family protein [Firmicutes bacterium]|jgi:HSP20 family protein|nr:Hsp20/alpha crystallin family protein [Bacillota bacterium]MDD4336169.1 Hsp20/alpha crystallin family protein [Bacillota bacterium]MDD4793027.1 Hsp20/alpha crystallin family protein [Bacillota bacterium]
MTLMNHDPWQELAEMRRVFNRMFGEGFAQLPTERRAAQGSLFMPVDITETSEEFVVTAELPGMNPDDIEITLSDNQVTIKGRRAAEQEDKRGNYLRTERRFGSFCRSFALSSPIADDKVTASYKDGILEVHLPKSEGAKPKQIEIRTE